MSGKESAGTRRKRLAAILDERGLHFSGRLDQIRILDEAHKGFSCDGSDDGHEGIRVEMWTRNECEQCSGGDEIGHDFCPVSEFCCGC